VTAALACQRHLFDIPPDVCFLNAGSWSPLPKSALALGQEAVLRKAQPWTMEQGFPDQQCEAARSAAAALINADAHDVAIISSISYGVATAAKALALPPNARIIVLADDHSSPVLEWTALPRDEVMNVRTVSPGADGDWTAALLTAIDEEGPQGLALVSVSNVHWADGGIIDMEAVRQALKPWDAALLIDATHAVGVIDMDIRRLDPDFMLFPTYKWLLGPYGRAFMYIAPRWQNSIPLEQTMSGRRRVRAEDPVYFTDLTYQPDARRFDMGQRDFFVSLDMARHGMELVQNWGQQAILNRLALLTGRIADGILASGLPVALPAQNIRAPHVLCLGFEDGMHEALAAALRAQNVHVAPRLGRLRITPHVYNNEQDCDRFIEALCTAIKQVART